MKFTKNKFLLGLSVIFVVAAIFLMLFSYFQMPQKNPNEWTDFRGARGEYMNGTLSGARFNETVAACSGKSFNDTCVFETPSGAVNASCQSFNGTLACRPVNGTRMGMGNFSGRR